MKTTTGLFGNMLKNSKMAAEMIDHGSRAHALLSASSAYRWLTCTPSARLEDKFKEDETPSVYAQEGTFAHELAEVELLWSTVQFNNAEYYKRKDELTKSEFYSIENEEEVTKYVDYVLDVWRDAIALDNLADIVLEDKMDLGEWVPEGFGTNDVVIIAGDILNVIDLKFGKGVKVSANENSQLKLYALGALEKHGINYDIKTVVLTIHQPRLGSVSTFELSAEELLEWGETVVKPTAKIAFEGAGEFVPGEHCGFCKAAPTCRALAKKNLELAKYDFDEPATLSDAELLDVYDKLDLLTSWAGKVKNYILAEAIAGKTWKGFKLVEGRSVRKIADEDGVAKILEAAGLKPDQFTNIKLKGLTDLTKLVGKKEFETLLTPFIIKPPGAPTLAPLDDPRPAFSSIEQHKKDFE